MRCCSTGRKCEGYPFKSVTRKEICDVLRRDTTFRALLDLQTTDFDNDQERRLFDYFRFVTAPKCCLFIGSDFWARRVLQISHSDPAIRHAALALGALQLERESADPLTENEQCGSAFRSYTKAIAHTSRLLVQSGQESLEKGLVACVLFICYENLLGRFAMAQMHLQNGLRILSEATGKPSCSGEARRQEIPHDILHVFSRLDFQAMSFSECSSPYPYVNSFHRSKEPESVPLQFASLVEAQYHLFEHIKWIFLLGEILGTSQPLNPQALVLSKSKSDAELTRWLNAFDSLLDRLERESAWTHEMQYASKLLRIYHTMIVAYSSPVFLDSELQCDQHYSQFESMLDLLESLTPDTSSTQASARPLSKLSFSFEMGVVLPLFVVSFRCRDPQLRRRAIAQLYSVNRREGLWDSRGAAKVAEAIMDMEEDGLEVVERADQIAKEKRIHELFARVNWERREIRLNCITKPCADGPYESRDRLVQF